MKPPSADIVFDDFRDYRHLSRVEIGVFKCLGYLPCRNEDDPVSQGRLREDLVLQFDYVTSQHVPGTEVFRPPGPGDVWGLWMRYHWRMRALRKGSIYCDISRGDQG